MQWNSQNKGDLKRFLKEKGPVLSTAREMICCSRSSLSRNRQAIGQIRGM